MIVVKRGDEEGRLSICHWWPEREHRWDHQSPIPAYIRRKARRNRNKYLTMVSVVFPCGQFSTWCACHPTKDQPTREAGRFIALLRMGRLLKSMGLKWERV